MSDALTKICEKGELAMFCGYCGASLPDNAVFCGNCGKPVGNSGNARKSAVRENIDTAEINIAGTAGNNAGDATGSGSADSANAVETGGAQEKSAFGEFSIVEGNPVNNVICAPPVFSDNRPLYGSENLRKDKKKFIIAGVAAAAVLIVAVIAGHSISTSRKIGKLEDAILHISASGYMDEDEIIKLYKEYDSLSDSNKRKVSNRETIVNAYRQVEALIAQREQAAAQVDNIIEAIDYSSIYAQASAVKDAVAAYNNLDDKTREYVGSYEKLEKAYNDVKDLNMRVTAENFYELFAVEYSVGELNNYGGTSISQSGYWIDWDIGTVTPNYDIDEHNDYATPVYVYIAPRYPNLACSCSFHIDLHQTYTGIGLVDSDTHEFKLQSADIQFDSSQGIGEYLINVEDNDASGSLLNIFGWSYDWSDSVHQMNPFDVSRVEISGIDGSVIYY